MRHSERFLREGQAEFNSQWRDFKNRQIEGLTDLRVSTYQDLEQVYLLHVNERYKNLFLSQSRSVINYGLICAVVLAT
jgi:hypothetical protein